MRINLPADQGSAAGDGAMRYTVVMQLVEEARHVCHHGGLCLLGQYIPTAPLLSPLASPHIIKLMSLELEESNHSTSDLQSSSSSILIRSNEKYFLSSCFSSALMPLKRNIFFFKQNKSFWR